MSDDKGSSENPPAPVAAEQGRSRSPSDTGRVGIQVRGLYDGVAVWAYPDGTLVNRFAQDNAFASEVSDDPLLWSDRYVKAADEWIANNKPSL